MKADGKDRLQHGDRRLNKSVALLLGPSRTLGALNSFGYRDAQILVQGDKPIALGSLRKQRTLHSQGIVGQIFTETRFVCEPIGQLVAPGDVKQSSCAGPVA